MVISPILAGWFVVVALMSSVSVFAQAPGVKIVHDRGEDDASLLQQANQCREAGQLLASEATSSRSN